MKKFFRALARSKTLIFAQLLAGFGVLQANQDMVSALLADPVHRAAFIVGVAVIVAVLRATTEKSLSDKTADK